MLELEHPTIVRLLDRLETLGLIERHAMENDRRAKQVLLTEKALPYVHEVVEVSDQMRHALLDTIDDATGNFTKVAQRIPVRIAIEADPSIVDDFAPGRSVVVTTGNAVE